MIVQVSGIETKKQKQTEKQAGNRAENRTGISNV